MTTPTPPEPVGDWAAWSAGMHARLHPTRSPFAQRVGVRAVVNSGMCNGMVVIVKEFFDDPSHGRSCRCYTNDLDDCRCFEISQLIFDDDEALKHMGKMINQLMSEKLMLTYDVDSARAERDALRSRLAELEAWIKVAKDWIPDDAARDDFDRLTRDGGGR